jgi:uncharacterized membrane protein
MTRWFYLALAVTIFAFAVSGYFRLVRYDDLPERIPLHWNIHGQADGWIAKQDSLASFFLLPLIMLGLLGLTLLLPWISPRQFQVRGFIDSYGLLMALVVALLGYLHVVILAGSLREGDLNIGRWIVGGLLAFLGLIGLLLPKTSPNFWLGIRTPWTLASGRVWRATHRLAAWLFVGLGLIGVVAVAAGIPLAWCFAALIAVVVLTVGYSLIYYKWLERHDRLEAAG